MSLETLNLVLFSDINASAHASHAMILFSIFIAKDTLFLLFAFLLYLWFYGDFAMKERAIRAVFLTLISLFIGYLISLFYYHPRPFVMHLGRTLIEHRANESFPSNHMLIFSTIGLSYLFTKRWLAGGIIMLFAFAVAWARIYVGVHFPLDMLGGFIIALLVNIAGAYFWPTYGQVILNLCIRLYHFIFSPLIKKGWVK